jgi:hypothetical protein
LSAFHGKVAGTRHVLHLQCVLQSDCAGKLATANLRASIDSPGGAMRRFCTSVITCVVFGGCAEPVAVSGSTLRGDARFALTPEAVALLRGLDGKTFVHRGGGRWDNEERRIQIASDGSVNFGYWTFEVADNASKLVTGDGTVFKQG